MASSGAAVGKVANIKVMSPSPQVTSPLNFALPLDSTIRQLKDRITTSLDSKPDHTQQRLIYRGRILEDVQSIASILGASANGEDSEISDSYTFHLALRPSGTTPVSTPGPRTSLFSASAIPPVPSIPAAQNAGERGVAIQRQRESIQEAIGNVRQRLDRINDLTSLATSLGTPAPAVVTRVETRTISWPREPTASASGASPRVRTTTTRTTTATVGLPRASIARHLSSLTSSPISANRTQGPPANNISVLSALNADLGNIISNLRQPNGPPPPQLYLLQGPDGQCLLLAGPATSRASTENLPTLSRTGVEGYLPGENPNSPIQSDLPVLEGVSAQHIAQILNPTGYGFADQNQHANANRAPTLLEEFTLRERARLVQAGQNLQQPHQQLHHQVHQQAQLRLDQLHQQMELRLNQQHQQAQLRLRQMNMAEFFRRVQEGGPHIWLAIRLIIFVALFSGGGGWRRKGTLVVLAMVIFVWQTGILAEYWRSGRALYREIFPPQPVAPPRMNNAPAATDAAGAPLDPSATANMLVHRHNERQQTRMREAYESVERVVALFVASLVPGMHERHVRAHEERERQRTAGAEGGERQGDGNEAPQPNAPEEQLPVEDAMGGLLVGL